MLINTHGSRDTATANTAIQDFFDCYTLPDALQVMDSIITAACSTKAWKGKAPFHVLFFMQHLQQLFEAAAVLQQRHAQLDTVKLPAGKKTPDMQQLQQYCNPFSDNGAWHWFPRHLGRKQYTDPYRVLGRFSKQFPGHRAQELAAALTEYALSTYAIDGEYDAGWVLTARRHLLQLIEACHLILVRMQHTVNSKQ